MKRTLTIACVLSLVALLSSSVFAAVAPLDPNKSYKIEVFKIMSSGVTSSVTSSTATTDANGKLDFTLTTMPTKDDANFIYLELQDPANGDAVVRQGIAPAPPDEVNSNKLGINEMAAKQAKVFKEALALAGSDDPVMVAYLMVILRSPGLTDADIPIIAQMGKNGILGASGFEGFLTTQGITAQQLVALRSCLIYNTDATKKTLRNFTESYYDAVNAATSTDENSLMQKAGGFMAEIFIDAAICADIPPELILAAHNAAGDAVGPTLMTTLGTQNPQFMVALESAMTSFHMRIAASKVAYEYTDALKTLGATGTQVTTFLDAGQGLMNAMANIESTYAGFYIDPAGYAAANNKTVDVVETEKNAAYNTAFQAFQTAIQSTDADIAALTTKILTSILPQGAQLPADFGKYRDFSGTQKNWPIPQTVMVDWLANILIANGSLSYTRDTTSLPAYAEQWWMGPCVIAVPDQATCQANVPGGQWDGSQCIVFSNKATCTTAGGTWSARHDFGTQNPFAPLLGLQEDIGILEMTRYEIYNGGTDPTNAEERAAKVSFQDSVDALVLKIGGTKDGTTLISSHEKEAVITVMKQPSMD